ncbi:histidine kinase [Algoriphagus halophilus]|uniref:sensor histidine kinase n=1 Tax=Algoriphagus halophilus TaxID=226505 RepID=UPI00358EAACD
MTEAELKAIRAQLNPHFLFNALSSIQNLVSQQKNEAANTYITKLSRLLREVLSASNSQFHELEQELNLIQLYLELEQLRFSFTSRIQISEQVSLHQLVPVMLLQPYVENAVKHGVAGMGKNGVIQIDIQQKDQLLLIDILDNGPGLSKPTTGSSGLHLSEERIRNLNKLYAGEASVDIKNREDGVGVQVRIKLPLE